MFSRFCSSARRKSIQTIVADSFSCSVYSRYIGNLSAIREISDRYSPRQYSWNSRSSFSWVS